MLNQLAIPTLPSYVGYICKPRGSAMTGFIARNIELPNLVTQSANC
jgi:hypothetical protein